MYTKSQFEQFYTNYSGVSYVVPADQVGFFNFLLNKYQDQLKSLNIFNFTNSPSIRRYRIAYCQLQYLPVPLWQSITAIKKIDIKTNVEKILIENTDYTTFDSKVNIFGFDYIQALDFKCLSCNCQCEVIQIEGIYGVMMPDSLRDALFLIIYKNLQIMSTIGVNACNDIESISAGNISIRNRANKTDKMNINNILSYPEFENLKNYQMHFLKIY